MSALGKVKLPGEFASLEEAVERIKTLESLMARFAQVGIVMSNAKYNLAVVNRVDEPAGGYWINGLQTAVLKPADFLFFNAIEVYGQERAESEFCIEMERVRLANEAAREACADETTTH